MVKISKITIILMLIVTLLPVFSICTYAADAPIITVGSIEAQPGGSISVPIELENNTGICGAVISVKYSDGLVLTDIQKGTALPSLVMTRPGDYTANPFNLVWDGMEQDVENGTLAILTFTVPETPGTYDIEAFYDPEGGIVDGNLNPVTPVIIQGSITVPSSQSETVMAENIGVFTADEGYIGDAVNATAFKSQLNSVSGTILFTVTSASGEKHTFSDSLALIDANVVFGIVVSGLADPDAICEITVK